MTAVCTLVKDMSCSARVNQPLVAKLFVEGIREVIEFPRSGTGPMLTPC